MDERIAGADSRSARLIRPARRLNLITCVHKRSRTPANKFLFACREQARNRYFPNRELPA